MSNPDALHEVFALLDRWRHFPNYQLERRADIFFAVYLRSVLAHKVGVALHETIIPEFPLKRDLIWPDRPTSQSVKVDYVLFAEDLSRVFFAELKTDGNSRNDKQDHYLERASEIGFRTILGGVRDIVLATTSHQKYHHLVAALADLDFLSVPDDLQDHLYPHPRPGLTKRLRQIEVADANPTIEVWYVQPAGTEGDRCIDFATFASHVEKSEDPFSQLFAEHLRRWVAPAGAAVPAEANNRKFVAGHQATPRLNHGDG